MDDKIKQMLKLSLSSSSSSSSMMDEEEKLLYETIEAPKFVDFTRPNHFCPDDRFWFCSRVGCDRKHEEEMDSEAIYKNFVLRVMAARSPNVRLRKALIRKPTSDTKKCPLSAPPKQSKSRLPRSPLPSSISKNLATESKDTTVPKIPTTKPSTTPKARVKHVAAKYMTSPRKKKPASTNPNTSKSVRNPIRTSITIPKKKVIAKGLVFNSPRKAIKSRKVIEEMATPITKLCEGVKRLEIGSHKKGNGEKPPKEGRTVRKLLGSECQRVVKTQQDGKFCASVKSKKRQNEEKRGKTEENCDSVSENALLSETISSEETVSVLENHVEKKDEKRGEMGVNSSETEHGNHELKVVVGEQITNDDKDDDKENVSKPDDIRNLNGGNQMKSDAPLKHKTLKPVDKKLKENCSAENGAQGVKYRKLKTTNPKPFRLRTDERGILKETTTACENSQCTTNGASENGNKETKISKRVPIKSKHKIIPKEVESKLDREVCSEKSYGKTKSSLLPKQVTKVQREVVPRIKTAPLRAQGKNTAVMKKQKDSEKRGNVVEQVKKPTVPREPNFRSLHKPKPSTKNVECSVF